jgi:hypothetical protein
MIEGNGMVTEIILWALVVLRVGFHWRVANSFENFNLILLLGMFRT